MRDIFDVAIIGAGVCGANIARKLSQYELKVALLEKRSMYRLELPRQIPVSCMVVFMITLAL